MKIKNFKYVLESFFKQLFILFVLSCPIIVNGAACETEQSNLQSCWHCLNCSVNPSAMGCVGNECDGFTTVNGCSNEESAYNSCMQNEGGQNPDGGGNNEQGSNGQSNNQGQSNPEELRQIKTDIQQVSREDNNLLIKVFITSRDSNITHDNLNCNLTYFSINGSSHYTTRADEILGSTQVAICNLSIDTNADTVSITAREGIVESSGVKSQVGNKTFTRTCTEPNNGHCNEGCALLNDTCLPASTACSGSQAAPGGGSCTGCAEGTIPNENHTKCICNPNEKCCGIQLNTVVPFIGDCIELDTDSSRGDTTSVNSVTAFPILMQGLMKIVMSVIMVFSFLMVIVSGLMMTAGAFKSSSFDKGKSILKNVIISLILLGSSGLILSLINPSFFGG